MSYLASENLFPYQLGNSIAYSASQFAQETESLLKFSLIEYRRALADNSNYFLMSSSRENFSRKKINSMIELFQLVKRYFLLKFK